MNCKLILFFVLLLGSYQVKAKSNARLDSMKHVIYSSTDSAFFSEWTGKIIDVPEFNAQERNQLINWFLDRSIQLNNKILNAQFKFRKSIEKTITGDFQEALDLINEAIPYFKKEENAIWLAACYNSAGGMIAQQGNVEQGVTYLKKAISLAPLYQADSVLKSRALYNHYNGLGNIYANDK